MSPISSVKLIKFKTRRENCCSVECRAGYITQLHLIRISEINRAEVLLWFMNFFKLLRLIFNENQ